MKLLNDRPDFNQLVEQLQAELKNRNRTWNELSESASGQTLIEFAAAIGSFLNFSLERSIQELFPSDATLESSIFKNASFLGVNPRRTASAKVLCDLGLPEILPILVTVPKYSQFTIDGKSFYNTHEINFAPGETLKSGVLLEQGVIRRLEFEGTGVEWQKIFISSGFIANENLMEVEVDNEKAIRERSTLWGYSNSDLVFLETTRPSGEIRILFPSSEFGKIPAQGSAIKITYAESIGSDANTAESSLEIKSDFNIDASGNPIQIEGLTTSGIYGGAARESSENLRYTAPRLFAANRRAIRRDDYKAHIRSLPNLNAVDANVWGEYELGSLDATKMNILNITALVESDTNESYSFSVDLNDTYILTLPAKFNIFPGTLIISTSNEVANDQEHGVISGNGVTGTIDYVSNEINLFFDSEYSGNIDFEFRNIGPVQELVDELKDYLNNLKHVTTQINFIKPRPVIYDLEITLYVNNTSESSRVFNDAVEVLNKLHARKEGSLSNLVYESSIYTNCTEIENVDYCVINESNVPESIYFNEFLVLGNLKINIGASRRG